MVLQLQFEISDIQKSGRSKEPYRRGKALKEWKDKWERNQKKTIQCHGNQEEKVFKERGQSSEHQVLLMLVKVKFTFQHRGHWEILHGS